jgi:hypothetical protein
MKMDNDGLAGIYMTLGQMNEAVLSHVEDARKFKPSLIRDLIAVSDNLRMGRGILDLVLKDLE